METLNDLQKEHYKSALKNILTLDDLNRILKGQADYMDAQGPKQAGRAIDKTLEAADKAEKPGAKMIPIISDAVEWIKAAEDYNADPTNAKKDQIYSEKAFRFYNNFLPFGGIVFSMMADTLEDARDRAEFEANQRRIMNKIISDYETRAEIERRKMVAAMDRVVSEPDALNLLFGQYYTEEPRWHTLRYFSDAKIEKIARYMQEHPDSRYNAYNSGFFLRTMKNDNSFKEAFLKNMKGGGPAGFAKHSPVYMTITDPFGHEYGVDPQTKRMLCDDAAICLPLQKAGDPEYLVIPSIYDGVYHVQLVGYDNGEYNFLFQGFNHNSELQGKIRQTGYIHKGEVLEANLTIKLGDDGYDVSTTGFMKINDSYPIPSDPENLLPAIDKDPFEIYFEGEPCLVSSSFSTATPAGNSDMIMDQVLEGAKKDYYICLKKPARPTYSFFTNKMLDPETINEDNLIVTDGNGNVVTGLIEVKDFIFSFTPNKPLIGEATILLKGGIHGMCGQTQTCLGQDLEYSVVGLEPSPEWDAEAPFELIPSDPMLIMKNVQITNTGPTAKEDIRFKTLSFKSFPPNVFFFIYTVSSPVPYEVLQGENNLIEFTIREMKPQETLSINLTYVGISWGVDYFSHLDLNKAEYDYNPDLQEKFTQPDEGIESDDPRIKALAQEIVGEEENPFWKAYKIYQWITSTITYDYEKAARADAGESVETGALLAMQKKSGTCDDYTKLFIALARASGVPARFVTLYVLEEKARGHGFPEVYIPPYDWIPLDPTWGVNFEAFARIEPGLAILAKEDGITENHKLQHSLEGRDTREISVSSSISGGILKVNDADDWNSLFKDPFFLDTYHLTILSELNDRFFRLENYNLELRQQLFSLPEKPSRSVVAATQQALKAYLDGRYLEARPILQETIAEQLQAATTSFSLLAQTLQSYVEGPSFAQSMLLHGISAEKGGLMAHPLLTKEEILLQINQTKKDMDYVREQFLAGNSYAAVQRLKDSYGATSWNYAILTNDLVVSRIKTLLLSPQNVLRLNKGTISAAAIIFVFFILLPVFWFCMWVNCLMKKEFRHLNRVAWFLIVFFIIFPIPFIPFGAIVYFFAEFRKKKGPSKK
ncbi:transglutaminase domain-containing protein [Candidatus Woesearchaeota archaeon]|nr:transglutaminase domain-containing protein [Candidatus Woesearchaeota archaeon]